jgi:hypothetical protein
MRYDQRDRLVRERTKAVNRLRNAAMLLGVTDLPKTLSTTKHAQWVACRAESFRDHVQLHEAAQAVLDDLQQAAEDVVRLNDRICRVITQLRPLVRATSPELLELRGVSQVVAAGLIGHAGDMRNVRDAAAFAMKAGVSPVPCSSGQNRAVRVNQGGDRQLNRLLHIIAIAQVRCDSHAGSLYYRRKRAEGKTHRSALRCLKRQLATVVYYRLREAQLRQDAGKSPPSNSKGDWQRRYHGLVRSGERVDPRSGFEFVKANQAAFPVRLMCRTLLSPSGYYAWSERPPAARTRANEALLVTMRGIYAATKQSYGRPRMYAELRDDGVLVNHKRVGRLMKLDGLVGITRRRKWRTTKRDRDARPAPDLVQRNFVAAARDQLWVADITYIPTWSGFLYLSVVVDAWSRRVVGWSMETHLRTDLVLQALNMAISQRRRSDVIHHSDQGSQYTSIAWG